MTVSIAMGCGASTLAKRDSPFGANFSDVRSIVLELLDLVVDLVDGLDCFVKKEELEEELEVLVEEDEGFVDCTEEDCILSARALANASSAVKFAFAPTRRWLPLAPLELL